MVMAYSLLLISILIGAVMFILNLSDRLYIFLLAHNPLNIGLAVLAAGYNKYISGPKEF